MKAWVLISRRPPFPHATLRPDQSCAASRAAWVASKTVVIPRWRSCGSQCWSPSTSTTLPLASRSTRCSGKRSSSGNLKSPAAFEILAWGHHGFRAKGM
jgi:hypothetical protein